MTLEEFNNIAFNSKMKINYNDNIHDICGVDFEDKMICVHEIDAFDLCIWVDYNECEIIQ